MSWSDPLKIAYYLSDPAGRHHLRPPEAPGIYVISQRLWAGSEPAKRDGVLYVGQSAYLRYRVGQLLADTLGFTGDNPGYSGSYYHSGDHQIWQHCLRHKPPAHLLYIAWYANCLCLDCAEIGLIASLAPPLNTNKAGGCAQHPRKLPLRTALAGPVGSPSVKNGGALPEVSTPVQSWLMYWRPDTNRSGLLDHAASDQLSKVSIGDEVWFVTIEDRELLLFGHMVVGEILSQARAEAAFGKDVWEAKYHIVPKGSPEPYVDTLITHLALDLRFEGGVTRLPADVSGRNLQTIRKLTSGSVAILRGVWTRPRQSNGDTTHTR